MNANATASPRLEVRGLSTSFATEAGRIQSVADVSFSIHPGETLALVIVYTPRVARVVRATTLVLRELLFVDAARALGVRTPKILCKHILPNLMSPILVQVTFIFAYAILAEAGLSFLGVGVPPDIPTWGTMIAGSLDYADRAFWTIFCPGLAIVLTALSLQMLGDGVRDLLDPKLRKAA